MQRRKTFIFCIFLIFFAGESVAQRFRILSSAAALKDSAAKATDNQVAKKSRILFPVRKDQKWGLIDTNGHLFVNPLYDGIFDYDNYGFAKVFNAAQTGLINFDGHEILPTAFDDVKVYDSIYIGVQKDGKWGVYKNNGTEIITPHYDELNYIRDNLFSVNSDSLYGVVNAFDQVALKPEFDTVVNCGFNFLKTRVNNLYGLCDQNGKKIFENEFSDIIPVNRDFVVCIVKSGLAGGYTSSAEKVVDTVWTSFYTNGNLVVFRKNDFYRIFSTKTMKFTVSGTFKNVEIISQEFAIFMNDSLKGILSDKDGIILPAIFDKITLIPGLGFMADSNRYRGFYALSGKVILPPVYDEIVISDTLNYLTFKKDNLWGVATMDGKILVQNKGDDIELYPDKIKIYREGNLNIYNVDSNFHLTDSMTFENVHRIRVVKPWNSSFPALNMRTIQYYGWYYSQALSLWGLKDSNNKVRIIPKYTDITLIQGCPITLVERPAPYFRSSFKIGGKELDVSNYYGLVNHFKYRIITNPQFLDIRLEDFARGYNIARIITPADNRFGYISRNGKIINRDIGYIGDFSDSMLPVNYKGKVEDYDINMVNNPNEKINLTLDFLRFVYGSSTDDRKYRTNGSYISVKGGSWGFLDQNGKLAIPAIYNRVRQFKQGRAIVLKDKKWGIIDKQNKTVVGFDFDEIEILGNSNDSFYRLLIYSGKSGLIDRQGKVYCEKCFDETGKLSEGLLKFRLNGKWGFANSKGEIVIEAVYNAASDFSEGLAAVKVGRIWGYIDKNGVMLIEPRFNKCGSFKEGFAWVILRAKTGYIDKSGNLVIQANYNQCGDFDRDRAIVRKSNKLGVIDKKGNWIVRPVYTYISSFDEYGLAVVRRSYRCGLINMKGKKLTLCRFREIGRFSEGLALASVKSNYGYLDTNGKTVINFHYQAATPFSEGFAAVRSGKSWGFINKKDQVKIPFNFSKAMPFHENRAIVMNKRHYGIIDKNGNIVLATVFGFIDNYNEGKTFVKDQYGKGTYVDSNGKRVFALRIEYGKPFKNDRALVVYNHHWGIIDQYGNFIASPNYISIVPVYDSLFSYRSLGYMAVCDINGRIFLEPVYESIKYLGKQVFKVEQANKTGYMKSNMKWLWKPTQ